MRALASKFGVNTKKHKPAKLWQRIATLLTAFVVMGSALAQIAQAAPGDYVWQKAGTNLSGDRSYWQSIASSSNDHYRSGRRLARQHRLECLCAPCPCCHAAHECNRNLA